MRFNKHYRLNGKHAFLSPSKYHWVNYDDDHFLKAYANHRAAQRGTELHALAAQAIKLGVKLPRSKKTINMYVNDGIGYRMTPEQPLYYSDNCFGTADTISFRKDFLRIHDLKTGVTPASMMQLKLYAAIFCLEYGVSPGQIGMELRIYQSDDIVKEVPDYDEIAHLMDKIVYFDGMLDTLEED